MRHIWAIILLLAGVSGPLLTWIGDASWAEPAEWLAYGIGVSPLPAVYSGQQGVEDFRTRLIVRWIPQRGGAQKDPTSLSSQILTQMYPETLDRRALVGALQSWVSSIDDSSERALIQTRFCSTHPRSSGFELTAQDAVKADRTIRKERFSCRGR